MIQSIMECMNQYQRYKYNENVIPHKWIIFWAAQAKFQGQISNFFSSIQKKKLG